MFISPRHILNRYEDITKWEFERKVDLFHAVTDGWHLEVADRAINGWRTNGFEHIHAKRLLSRADIHWIPDAGWAAIQMSINYFEVVGRYKFAMKEGKSKTKNTFTIKERFERGCVDIFPQLDLTSAPEKMYKLRNGLYHTGDIRSNVFLSRLPQTVTYNTKSEVVKIDPHRFVKHLRTHLADYCVELLQGDNSDLMQKFEEAFNNKYRI